MMEARKCARAHGIMRTTCFEGWMLLFFSALRTEASLCGNSVFAVGADF
jgi:hypothetical protein